MKKKYINDLLDALNRIDELAGDSTQEIETLEQLEKDYIALFDFINNHQD